MKKTEKKSTVKKRIFKNNNWMVMVILALCLIANAGIAKIYVETIEKKWNLTMEKILSKDQMKALLEEWNIRQHSFLILFVIDIALCVGILMLVSRIFANILTTDIMKPLKELSKGAERIRKIDMNIDIDYSGDEEFENVCENFNKMQSYIKSEKEKMTVMRKPEDR